MDTDRLRFRRNNSFLFYRDDKGVGLVTAIIVISALAMLGTVMMQLIVTERSAATRSVASTRALLAAQAAQEWSMYQTFVNSSPPSQGIKVFDSGNIKKSDYLSQCVNETKVVKVPRVVSPWSVVVEGTCYDGTSSEARRRLGVRFFDPV